VACACGDSSSTYSDVTTLASAIRDAIDDPNVRDTARQTARVVSALDWGAVAIGQAGIYSEVL
jgi:hypothetical protein